MAGSILHFCFWFFFFFLHFCFWFFDNLGWDLNFWVCWLMIVRETYIVRAQSILALEFGVFLGGKKLSSNTNTSSVVGCANSWLMQVLAFCLHLLVFLLYLFLFVSFSQTSNVSVPQLFFYYFFSFFYRHSIHGVGTTVEEKEIERESQI